jgi:hypothetical protein
MRPKRQPEELLRKLVMLFVRCIRMQRDGSPPHVFRESPIDIWVRPE